MITPAIQKNTNDLDDSEVNSKSSVEAEVKIGTKLKFIDAITNPRKNKLAEIIT